jgi:25S rRNA (uracil2634-N3)-methyltransferase
MSKKRKVGQGQARHAARPAPPSARSHHPTKKISNAKPGGGGGGGGGHAATHKEQPKHHNHHHHPHHGSRQSQPQSHPEDAAIVPFGPDNRILLVGEADLSFAASLVRHHGCLHVTATVLEADAAELEAKYPDTAAANARAVADASPHCRVLYGVDACARGPFRIPGRSRSRKKRKRGPLSAADEFNVAEPEADAGAAARDSVDDDIWDRIVFNFPHVGGKSKDVNRQVRYNQELLVAFFERAKPSLAAGGAIIVTIFEGEPYSLWNVRDLGRHSGLRVERSFRFRADAYPGYHHARTLGVVRNKKTGEAAATAWRGEDRPSRCFVLVRKEDENVQIEGVSFVPRKKRKRDDDDDDVNEEEGEEIYPDYGESEQGEEGDDSEGEGEGEGVGGEEQADEAAGKDGEVGVHEANEKVVVEEREEEDSDDQSDVYKDALDGTEDTGE